MSSMLFRGELFCVTTKQGVLKARPMLSSESGVEDIFFRLFPCVILSAALTVLTLPTNGESLPSSPFSRLASVSDCLNCAFPSFSGNRPCA